MVKRIPAGGVLAAALLLMPLAPARAGDDLLGEDFEAFTGIPRSVAEPLTDDDLDGLRGRFFEVFFGVEFFGRAAIDGTLDATLDVQVSFVDPATGAVQNGNLSFPNGGAGGTAGGGISPNGATTADLTNPITGDVFRVANIIDGSFGNGNGSGFQAQVIQNNGDTTRLQNIAIMNFAILNVVEAEAPAARAALQSFFGTIGQ